MSYILGTKIDDISLEQALEQMREFFYHETCNIKHETRLNQGYIATPNPEICLQAKKDQRYQNILNNAFLSLPDGFGLKIGAMLLGQRLKNRVTGVDFTLELMKLAAEENWRVFLFGGEEGVARECQKALEERYRGLKIVGTMHGQTQNSKLKTPARLASQREAGRQNHNLNLKTDLIRAINDSKSDILLVALGAPLQEKWIAENLAHLPTVKLAIGVGGTFDFIAGRVKRAPRLIRQLGLEWLWRLILQPWRYRRIYNAVLKFMAVVIKWRIRMLFVYRRNVCGLVICGSSSEAECLLPKQKTAGSIPVCRSISILLVERKDESGHWQLPQGGIEAYEPSEQAVTREMIEELGTDKFRIIKCIPKFYRYKWPKLDKIRRGYRGQIQDLFILRFTGADADIKLDKKEVVNFKWVNPSVASRAVHPCRREQMQMALKNFEHLLSKQNGI